MNIRNIKNINQVLQEQNIAFIFERPSIVVINVIKHKSQQQYYLRCTPFPKKQQTNVEIPKNLQ